MKLAVLMVSFFLAHSSVAWAEGGLPQLDPTTYSTQIFWLFVTFFLIFFLMSKVVVPKLDKAIAHRDRKRDEDLERASALKEDADKLRVEYETLMAQSAEKSQALLKQTQTEVAGEYQDEINALTQKLKKQSEQAEEAIEKARSEALSTVQEISTALAVEAANKLASIAINDNDAAKVVKTSDKEAHNGS